MSEAHADPVAHANSRVVSYVTLAATALESVVAARAAGAERDAAAHRQHQQAHDAARRRWAPAVSREQPGGRTLEEVATAWAAGQGWREHDPEAAAAVGLAEQRLRELDPDAVARLDRLRATGLDDVDALRLAAPALDDTRARAAAPAGGPAVTVQPAQIQPGQGAAGQGEADRGAAAARLGRAADAEHVDAEGLLGVVDDPATPAVDEDAETTQAAVGARRRVDGLGAQPRAERSAGELAAEAYPLPLALDGAARLPAAGAAAVPAQQLRSRAAVSR